MCAVNVIIITDDNGCDTDPCDSNASCTDTDSSYICTCNEGYTGDGMTCTSKL